MKETNSFIKGLIWFSKKLSHLLDGFAWGFGFGLMVKLFGIHINIQ